jgi:DNA-binding GntR family transcriptional regulator
VGLIRKSLRAGLFVASPLTAASVGNVKSESKKQRRAKATMDNTARIAAALENQPSAQESTPLRIAEERYARGEITREEFQQIKADLAS